MTAVIPEAAHWQRLAAILDQALELARTERQAYLDQACSGAPTLRAEIEALLVADGLAGGILETPVGDYAADIMDEVASDDPLVGRELGPYRVVRKIGSGGMGVVYVGWDSRLQRQVALKFLPPEWGLETSARERFLREARAASGLDHPNICTVHDVGESADGRLYIVMAYYQGETLKLRIERGPLAVAEALDVAIQIARGLAQAHDHGIIHRDVKPANVIISKTGGAKILDFGIAKMAGDAGITRTGAMPGTPAYMAPEHAASEKVDCRSDLWSLAAILHEMLTGRRPSRSGPEPASGDRPDPPAAVQRLLAKALASDPEERFQNAYELLAELEAVAAERPRMRLGPRWARLVAAGLVVTMIAIGGWWGWRARSPGSAGAGGSVASEPAVAVLGLAPFVNRTGNQELDWYGEGLARLVGDALSQSRHLQVVAKLRRPTDAPAAATELSGDAAAAGISVLLTGEILPGGQGLILTARLHETGSDGRQLAACRLDELDRKDLFNQVDEVAMAVRRGLAIPLTETVDVFAADFAAHNPAAYRFYVAGLRAFAEYHYEAAESAFLAALERAPDFTVARYRLAHVEAVSGRTGQALVRIRQAVKEADHLPDREARYIRATEAYIARRLDEAIAGFEEIITSYPYETEARFFLGLLLHDQGRHQEVLEVVEVLHRLAPEDHNTWNLAGSAHLALGNLNQAVLDLGTYVELAPESANAHHFLGDAYRAQSEFDLAAAEYAAALHADPAFFYSTVSLAVVRALQEQPEVARALLTDLAADNTAAPRHRIDAAFELAALYRCAGRFQEAASGLEALAELIAEEQVREAMALAVRGTSWLELGRYQEAARLIDLAVARSPGVPTRYLFARGLLELRQERFAVLAETVREILDGCLPADNPDRTEEKAAAYLRGLASLARGDGEQAITELSLAVALSGHEYAVYRCGLARAYLATGRLREAMAAARQAGQERDLSQPRLDLELDRVRSQLVLARIQAALGRPAAAAALARRFSTAWAGADDGLPELAVARNLAELAE